MASQRLKTYLDANHTPYLSIHHTPAYTSQEIAEAAHISGKRLAKTVIVDLGDRHAMVVVPASSHINFMALRRSLHNKHVTLSSERDFKQDFPDCATGMMPPFGNIYNMETYVAETLAQDDVIAFNAGVDDEIIEIAYRDYESLVHPQVLSGIAVTSQ